MIRPIAAALALALALAGCATSSPEPGFGSMAQVQDADLDTLAAAAVDMVRRSAKPDDNAIGIMSAGDDAFTNRLTDALRSAGFTVKEGDRLRYQVGPVGDHTMLRVAIDGTDASQLYGHDKAGRLAPVGPLSVWSVEP